jgi:MarR family transcriptional regulator, organic hydroperoxide resistance regulator
MEMGNMRPEVNADLFFEKYGNRILKAMRRIIRAVDIYSRKLNSEFEVTTPQMICMYSLFREGDMTLSQLAEHANLSTSTVNGIVDRLENKKLVVRERSREDRRKVYVKITAAGRELIKKAPSLLQDSFAESLQLLPELEQVAIALSLERVVELMEAQHLDASPNLISSGQLNEEKKGKE